MNKIFESVAVKLVTKEGYPIAVGGICMPGTGLYWTERFNKLASICISGSDIYNIDYTIAQAIQNISDESLLIAGCSLDAGVEFKHGESTGGVLGCPRNTISSASDICETLPEGFSMYTAPGGPGLAALADPARTERAAMAVKALGNDISGKKILDCITKNGISTFLLVMDGSGPNAHGCLAASSTKESSVIFLDR